jgi:hypothetical protein
MTKNRLRYAATTHRHRKVPTRPPHPVNLINPVRIAPLRQVSIPVNLCDLCPIFGQNYSEKTRDFLRQNPRKPQQKPTSSTLVNPKNLGRGGGGPERDRIYKIYRMKFRSIPNPRSCPSCSSCPGFQVPRCPPGQGEQGRRIYFFWSAATCRRFPTGRHVCQFQSADMSAHSTSAYVRHAILHPRRASRRNGFASPRPIRHASPP